jgi:hypothetical protein
MYRLSFFLEDPKFPDSVVLDGYWYFDNEEQLIGALEEQATLLRQKGITWLMGDYKMDLEEFITASSDRRKKKWDSSTQEEREIGFIQIGDIFEKWENRRVYPKEFI